MMLYASAEHVGIITMNLMRPESLLSSPWLLIVLAFQIWMLGDAIRRREYFWAVLIFFFSFFTAIFYYFLVYRAQPSATAGFELPGTHHRKRIRELQGQIHHLDKAHHHAELGDIYFQQGKLDDAEKCYRAAIERDPGDTDFAAHLGQCLLRKGDPNQARPLLEQVVRENPKHDYGYTMMAYAEALTQLGDQDAALEAWKSVLENHSYARARVQLAEIYLKRGEKELARKELEEVISDDRHAANFQRKQEKPWVRRARGLLKEFA
jgi:tetratricopeptide (TPR) repeat protein